jgi:mannose-6-phosphate isomerase-like protein (cupin superfamily)
MPEPDVFDVKVCRKDDARPLMEGGELANIYFMSDRIVFSSSVIPAGQKSSFDPGHAGAHEVVYCMKGSAIIEIGDGDGHFVRLNCGDAALIGDGVAHTAYNPGAEPAELIWAVAPHLGRELVHET